MEELLKQQIKHLATLESLMKTDRLMQLAQTYGIHNIDNEDDAASKTLGHISDSIDNSIHIQHNDNKQSDILSTINSGNVVKSIDGLRAETKDYAKTSQKAFAEYADKLASFKNIADNSIGTKASKTIGEKLSGKVGSIRNIYGDASTGKIGLGSIAGAVGRKLLPKLPFSDIAQERYDYIRDEKGRGSTKSKDELKENFEIRRKALIKNESLEKQLKKQKGGQSQSDFLKSGHKFAEEYKAGKIEVGKTLSKVDSNYNTGIDDKEDYIKNEKNLGSRKRTSTLEKNFDTREALQARNVSNEERLTKARGSLTEEEFLAGDQKEAKAYKKEQQTIGKGLEKVDSRYTLGRAKPEKNESKLEKATSAIGTVASDEATQIRPMANANLGTGTFTSETSEEDRNEAAYLTKEYQNAQLENNEEQTKIFEEQLDTLKEILKAENIIKDKPESGGGGIGSVLGAAADMAGSAGSVLKKAGSVAAKVAGAAAIPLAVGVAGAAALNYAATEFSDSFGEGGFDVVKKLQDDKIIDYNATVMGYNPSEVLDWEGIQKLKPEELKKLLDSGVEFSPEDTDKLHKVYTQSLITGGKEGSKPEQVTPETSVKPEQVTPESQGYQGYTPKPEDSISTPTRPIITGNETEAELDAMNKSLGYSVVDLNPTKATPEQASNVDLGDKGWMNPQVETTPKPSISQQLDNLDAEQLKLPSRVTPEVSPPSQAESIYNQSRENAGITSSTSAGSNVINAPTINNNSNTTKTSVIKLPVRNQEFNKYVSSRYSNQ